MSYCERPRKLKLITEGTQMKVGRTYARIYGGKPSGTFRYVGTKWNFRNLEAALYEIQPGPCSECLDGIKRGPDGEWRICKACYGVQ